MMVMKWVRFRTDLDDEVRSVLWDNQVHGLRSWRVRVFGFVRGDRLGGEGFRCMMLLVLRCAI